MIVECVFVTTLKRSGVMSDLLDQRDDYRRMCDAKHPRKNQPLRAACQEGRSKCQHQGVISNTVLDHVMLPPKYKVG